MALTWGAAAICDDRGVIQEEIQNLDFNEFQFLTSDLEAPPLHNIFGLL